MLSQNQKFRKSHMVAKELASLASEVGMSAFQSRLAVLKDLRDLWAKGKTAVVLIGEDHSSGITLHIYRTSVCVCVCIDIPLCLFMHSHMCLASARVCTCICMYVTCVYTCACLLCFCTYGSVHACVYSYIG